MRSAMTLVAAVALVGGVDAAAQEVAPIPEQVEAEAIRNYKRVSEQLAVGGQPSLETMRELKRLGFRTVVDLRIPGESEFDEGAIARESGLHYVSVPISSGDFSSADADAVGRVLDDEAAAPVLLHCASSNRVGGVLAVLEARRGGSIEDALAFGRNAGLESPAMTEAATRLIESER